MARKAEIQYIQHVYTNGSAAKKLAVAQEPKKAPLPFFEPEMMEPDQKIQVAVDPLAVSSIVVAAVLVVMMVITLFQFGAAYREQVALQEYVYALNNEQAQLEQTYRDGFDLEQIEEQALALGMIPAAEAQTVTIPGRVPARAAEPSFWEQAQQFFAELFANVNP